MEIAATGLSGSNALNVNSIAGADDPGFAVVLGALGSEVGRPSPGHFAAASSATKDAALFAAPEAPEKGTPTTGADLRPHLPSSGAIQTISLDPPNGEYRFQPLASSGQGEPLPAPLVMDEAPSPALPAPEAERPVPSGELKSVERLAHQDFVEGALPAAPGAPAASLTIEDAAELSVSPPSALSQPNSAAGSSPIPVVAAEDDVAMGTSPPSASPDEAGTTVELQAAPAIPTNETTRPIAAAAHSAQAHASPIENSRPRTVASRAQSAHNFADEPNPQPASAADSALELAEKFARGLPDSSAERVPTPASTAGARPSSNQTANPPLSLTSQSAIPASAMHVSQSPTPAGAMPFAAPAAVPVPALSVPDAALPPVERHPVMAFRADKVARDMGVEIARRISNGGQELVIRLDPAELGRISIRMSVNEHGQLRAIVAADAPSVVEAIRSDISELSRALEQAGIRTDSQSFRFDRGGSGDPGGQWQQRYQQPNPPVHDDEHTGIPVDDTGSYRPLAMNGRINMMA